MGRLTRAARLDVVARLPNPVVASARLSLAELAP